MKNESAELYYSVNDFSDQNKVIFRLYDTEDIEALYSNNGRKCTIAFREKDLYLSIADHKYVLKNIEEKYINQYYQKKIKIGFSFLDQYHAVINGFYL